MTNDEHLVLTGWQLEVHRVVPGSRYSDEPGVCVTLCRKCHGPKPKSPKGEATSDRHKPRRLVGIPERICLVLEEMGEERETNLTEMVKAGLIYFLEQQGRWPTQTPPRPKS